MPIQITDSLAALLAPPPDRASPTLSPTWIDLVADEQDPGRGSARVQVRGFSKEESRPLRQAFGAALQAVQTLQKAYTDRIAALAKGGTTESKRYAEAKAASESIGGWRDEAFGLLYQSTKEICRRGLVGYEPGEFFDKQGGKAEYSTEASEVGGASVEVASEAALAPIESLGLLTSLALAILTVSGGATWPSAEEQWAAQGKGNKKKEEA